MLSGPDTTLFPTVFATHRPKDYFECVCHKGPGFQAQKWVAIWADTELATGVYLFFFPIPQCNTNTNETEPFTPLERGQKPESQVVWLGRFHPHGAQQAKIHWLEILTASTAV